MADLDLDRPARRIRKKLRQIERLEVLDRELNEEEEAKVKRKTELRQELAEMKRRSNESADDPAKRKKDEAASSSSSSCNLNAEQELEISVSNSSSAVVVREAPSSSSEAVQVRVTTHPPSTKKGRSRHQTATVDDLPKREVMVNELDGHEDLALAADVDADRDMAVTAGRDTRVLVWKPSAHEQTCSLRGHTGAVTSLAVLPAEANAGIGVSVDDVAGLSGSIDCSLKVWNLTAGKLVKSIYTYNGIKCLAYSAEMGLVVTGTDGGKLEFFDLRSNAAVHSIKDAHTDVVTAVDFSGRRICSGSRDGIVKVWQMEDRKTVRCLFASEDVNAAEEEQTAHLRCIASLRLLPGELVAYGDSGCNVKVLDWKCGLLHKLPNHVGDVGFTDCLRLAGDKSVLLASSYDIDTGLGHTNVFKVVAGQTVPSYLCSWSDEETGRIHGIGASLLAATKELVFVTCGKEVKLWRTIKRGRDLPQSEDAVLVRASLLPLYSDEAVDSGSSDDSDLTEVDDEGSSEGGRRSRSPSRSRSRQSDRDQEESSSGWWCSIM